MKAMILAAGAGTRLQPLTFQRPKPMVPVVNRPNLGHILDKLAKSGIREAAMNLHMAPEQIRSYVDHGEKWGLKIRYSHERKLLGTAGSLIPLRDYFKGASFIVLSGDGISELSLMELAAFHKRQNTIATMVLAKTQDRCEYGLVTLNGKDRVQAIIEKPTWGEVLSPYINTGIYVLEPEIYRWLPKEGPFDFARDLWPKLLASGKEISAYKMDSYWCDIGNLKEYRRCHGDILDGKVKIPIVGDQVKPGIWVGRGTRIAAGVSLEAPAAIGDNVTIEKNAKILAYSVIGNGCRIGAGAIVKESILWEKVQVASRVKVTGCVLAERTVLKESVDFYEGAIIGVR